ncbi:MAG: VIT domain-containing protein [Armatimonadota bacterium]|nr:hypothetical protein [bacterium]
MNRFMLGLLILASIVFCESPSIARVLLKPAGGNSMPLCTRSVSADVTISGQFATTTLNLVFQNESSSQMEAEFMYELPKGAVATYFAYWAGDEKVVARVVEKEEAKKIYETIAYSWSRDPALIEMTGKNTFRARIFPVRPNNDLKVEIHTVQVLPSDESGALYTLPIFGKGALDPLDSIDVIIRVKPDAGIANVFTNYGIPAQRHTGGYIIKLSGENYTPPKDLNVRIVRRPAKMNASLYAARSGSKDGYFALALTPDHSLTSPSVSVDGVRTYDVCPTRFSSVKAYESLTIYGRYKGAGEATVTLRGKSPSGRLTYSAPVTFRSASKSNSLATSLWAAARIEQLSCRKSSRAAVVGISKRFGMPSKFTSWLAVPKEEMKSYRQNEYREKIDALASPLIDLIKLGKEDSKQGKRLTGQLNNLCKKAGLDPREELTNRAYDIIYSIEEEMIKTVADGKDATAQHNRLARLFGIEYSKGHPTFSSDLMDELAYRITELEYGNAPGKSNIATLKSRLEQLAASTGELSDSYLRDAYERYQEKKEKKEDRVTDPNQLAYQLLDILKIDQADSPKAQEVRNELAKYGYGDSPVKLYLRFAIEGYLRETCYNLPALIRDGGNAEAIVGKLQTELASAAKEAEVDLQMELTEDIRNATQEVAEKLAEAVAQGKESTPDGQMLAKQLQILSRVSQTSETKTFGDSAAYKLADLAQSLVAEQHKSQPDKHVMANLRMEMRRLEVRSGRSATQSILEAERQIKNDKMYQVGSDLAKLLIDGKGDSKPARAISAKYHTLCAQLSIDAKVQLRDMIKEEIDDLAWDYTRAKYRDNQDAAYLASLLKKMQAGARLMNVSAQSVIESHDEYGLWYALVPLQHTIIAEMQRKTPNKARLERLAKHYKSLATLYLVKDPKHSIYNSSFLDPYSSLLDKTISLRIESVALTKQMQTAHSSGDPKNIAQLQERQNQIAANFNKQIEQMEMYARWGDPLISVDAPANALRVIAIMPDGEIKTLERNADTRKWEARFDIPSYAAEGQYSITVIVVLNNGTRKEMRLSYNVDVTPPTGIATAIVTDKIRLEIAGSDTARATALLPWGERVEMRSSIKPGKFYAVATIPNDYRGAAFAVSYVLTDSAHNRTTITVEARSK